MDKKMLQTAIFLGYQNGCADVAGHILNKFQSMESQEKFLTWLKIFADTTADFDSVTVQKLAEESLKSEDTQTFINEMMREGISPSTYTN